MTVRAKMIAQSIHISAGQEEVTFSAVHGPGNEEWSQWTPNGELRLTITNDKARGQFKAGASYYLDISPVEAK